MGIPDNFASMNNFYQMREQIYNFLLASKLYQVNQTSVGHSHLLLQRLKLVKLKALLWNLLGWGGVGWGEQVATALQHKPIRGIHIQLLPSSP